MPIKLGLNNINNIKVGTTQIKAVYAGTKLVWSALPDASNWSWQQIYDYARNNLSPTQGYARTTDIYGNTLTITVNTNSYPHYCYINGNLYYSSSNMREHSIIIMDKYAYEWAFTDINNNIYVVFYRNMGRNDSWKTGWVHKINSNFQYISGGEVGNPWGTWP